MDSFNIEIPEDKSKKCQQFFKKLDSQMVFKSSFSGSLLSFDWLDEIENACPFIDIIIRIPKFALIREEEVVKIEKSKKITLDSVKDLSKHTNYINKADKKTNTVEPNKILDVRSEETFNIYENRFLYTLLYDLDKFLASKEKLLKNFDLKDNKILGYKGVTSTNEEKINIEVTMTSSSLFTSNNNDAFKDDLKKIKERVKRVRQYISSWQKSDMMKALYAANISLVKPPLKKTNLILKNPNFRIAVTLWEYLNKYEENNESEKDNVNSESDVLKGFMNHAFLIDYMVLDSMSKYKREQKRNMVKYSIILLNEEIKRVVSLLGSCGYDISNEELLNLIAKEINKEKSDRLVGVDDVKKKFKSAFDEYLERVQENL